MPSCTPAFNYFLGPLFSSPALGAVKPGATCIKAGAGQKVIAPPAAGASNESGEESDEGYEVESDND